MDRNYIFYKATTNICPKCEKRVSAKIILKEEKVGINFRLNICAIER